MRRRSIIRGETCAAKTCSVDPPTHGRRRRAAGSSEDAQSASGNSKLFTYIMSRCSKRIGSSAQQFSDPDTGGRARFGLYPYFLPRYFETRSEKPPEPLRPACTNCSRRDQPSPPSPQISWASPKTIARSNGSAGSNEGSAASRSASTGFQRTVSRDSRSG